MTLNELLDLVDKDDYDKPIVFSEDEFADPLKVRYIDEDCIVLRPDITQQSFRLF